MDRGVAQSVGPFWPEWAVAGGTRTRRDSRIQRQRPRSPSTEADQPSLLTRTGSGPAARRCCGRCCPPDPGRARRSTRACRREAAASRKRSRRRPSCMSASRSPRIRARWPGTRDRRSCSRAAPSVGVECRGAVVLGRGLSQLTAPQPAPEKGNQHLHPRRRAGHGGPARLTALPRC